ncbi:MAG: hypothetical protein ACXABF_15135 [Candidatus Thorarchaeota archaeon]
MKAVTWILRILSLVMFVLMCYFVYNIMSGYWDWDAPYEFIVTVFQLLSVTVFFLIVMVFTGIMSIFTGVAPSQTLTGLYNSLILRMWYMNPPGAAGPMTNAEQVFSDFAMNFLTVWEVLVDDTFTFLYFLFAALGVALFLQSLVRMDHKFVGGAFLSIQAILIVAAYRAVTAVPYYDVFPGDFLIFLQSSVQILAIVSFAYLEVSYQMIYSYSVGKPVEDREETLKKQLLALRQATRKQDAIERGEKVSVTGMSRSSGATAFSFLREAIERKVVGGQDALENLDAVADVRRLQIFVDELLSSDPEARNELTAKAAAPSSSYVISSTLLGSALRFVGVITISFLFMNTDIWVSLVRLPPGIQYSIELVQPEIVVLFLVPIIMLFPLIAMIIGWLSKREIEVKIKLTKEEKDAEKKRKADLSKKRKEAAKARREREKARKKKKASREEDDEWDKALEEAYKI